MAQFIDIPREQGDADEECEDGDYSQALSRFERDYLQGLLRKNRGNVEAAAREAGMNMATIYRKIKKYSIRKEDFT
jgi:DNA-binding NtrC family response regulator